MHRLISSGSHLERRFFHHSGRLSVLAIDDFSDVGQFDLGAALGLEALIVRVGGAEVRVGSVKSWRLPVLTKQGSPPGLETARWASRPHGASSL